MQKKSSIPTYLIPPAERSQVRVSPVRNDQVVRLLSLLLFLLGTLWRWLWVRWRPSLAQDRYSPRNNGRRLREFAERMGGLWVKICQLVAMRRDLFSQEFCEELSHLQDHASGFTPEEVREVLAAELKVPFEDIFSKFDFHPFAAASIGQIHEAHLRFQGRVAVKVQRPGIVRSFERDLGYARFIVRILTFLDVAPTVRWHEALEELEKTLTEELDYRLEATALSRMSKTLKPHKVYVPKVYLEHSTRKILVMEFVQGVFMSDYIKCAESNPARLQQWLKENQISPKRVGRRLYLSLVRQVFEDNLFHCDLHPGNILLLRKSRVCIIDFGSIGSFEKSLLEKYHMLFKAMTQHSYEKVFDLFMLMSPSRPDRDLSEAKQEVVRQFRDWETRVPVKCMAYHEKSLTHVLSGVARTFGRYGIPSTWEFLRLNRAQLTLDASLMFLIPNANFLKLAQQHEREAEQRAMKQIMNRETRGNMLVSLYRGFDAAGRWAENLYFDGEQLRKRAANFEGSLSKAADVGRTILTIITLGLFSASVFCILMYVQRHQGQHELLQGTWVHTLMARSPQLNRWTWLLLGGLGLLGSLRLLRLRRHMGTKEGSRQR